ncbi:uncharacterized protein VTP21DRAFT_7729 [Calcarisporiella thermophila]|uniref:uncharacterized protein n=1 Tax=Calcarisporiella thermophila TaxID=911321 RepID=UPI0037448B12
MNYARALQRGTNHQQRPSFDPPIKRTYSIKNAVIFNFTGIANREDGLAAVANKFGDTIIAEDENPRRDNAEMAIQFKKGFDMHAIIEEGFVIGDKIVPTHLLFDITNTALTIKIDQVPLEQDHDEVVAKIAKQFEQLVSPVIHKKLATCAIMPSEARSTIFLTLNVAGKLDGHEVFVTWPDCPPLCRTCLCEGHYSRECPKRANKPTSQIPQFTFNTPTAAINIDRRDTIKSKETDITRLQKEEQADSEGFTLVKRRKSSGKRKLASQSVSLPPLEKRPTNRVARNDPKTTNTQNPTLVDNRAPARNTDLTSRSSTSQHNSRQNENEEIGSKNHDDHKDGTVKIGTKVIDDDGMESDKMEDSSF